MPTPSHPRLITVSLHRLASAVIPLSALNLPTSRPRESVDLVSSQALNLLNSTSHSLCILPLITPISLSHYFPADLAALASLHRRLDELGFNCLATFSTHPFHLYSPLSTLRLTDFLRSSDLLAAPGHLIDLKPKTGTPPITPSEAVSIVNHAAKHGFQSPAHLSDDFEPCPCCRRRICVCPHGCSNCQQPGGL